MNWSDRMNSAIAYIENNLENDVDINEIAKHASSSSYHFQRMFFAIIGITPAEYIRRRKLTLAATDLASDNKRVIDIALKYGYQSPNAFTRALRNMHGVNPKDVGYADVKLSAFNRVFFHVEIKGGGNMNYKIIEKPCKLIFTIREVEIIKHLSEGKTFKEIAEILFVSPNTINYHKKNILKKSGCKNTTHVIVKCIREGII